MAGAGVKARIREPDRVCDVLERLAVPFRSTRSETWYDYPDERLAAARRALGVRTTTGAGAARHVLTYRDGSADPDHETAVGHVETVHTVFRVLGLRPMVTFDAHRVEYQFVCGGCELLATVVRIPELPDLFLELDVINGAGPVDDLLDELGIAAGDLTEEEYRRAVAVSRLPPNQPGPG